MIMDDLFRTTVILYLESLPLSCSEGAFSLEEKFNKTRMLQCKIPNSILCYNFHHGSVNSYHVGNTKERKLNSTKMGGDMLFIASSRQIIV